MASISWSDRGWTARKSHHLARYKTGSGWSCALTKVGKVNLRRSVLFDVCCTKGSVVEVAWGKRVVWVKGGVWSKGAGVVRSLVKGLYMQEDVFQLLVQVIYPDVLPTVFLWDVCLNGPRWCFFSIFCDTHTHNQWPVTDFATTETWNIKQVIKQNCTLV